MEKIIWAVKVGNEILQRIKEEWNTLKTIKRREANWNSHSLHRKCLLKHVVEGKIERRIDVKRS